MNISFIFFSVLSNQSGLNPYRHELDSPPYQTAASIPTISAMRGTEQTEKIEVQLLPQVRYFFFCMLSATEFVTNLDLQSEMIILKSLMTTFEVNIIFLRQLGSIKK